MRIKHLVRNVGVDSAIGCSSNAPLLIRRKRAQARRTQVDHGHVHTCVGQNGHSLILSNPVSCTKITKSPPQTSSSLSSSLSSLLSSSRLHLHPPPSPSPPTPTPTPHQPSSVVHNTYAQNERRLRPRYLASRLAPPHRAPGVPTPRAADVATKARGASRRHSGHARHNRASTRLRGHRRRARYRLAPLAHPAPRHSRRVPHLLPPVRRLAKQR